MLRAMGALAHLEVRLIPVEPGNQASTQVRVRNTGSVVDQFTIEILGDSAAWTTVQPPTLSLFPGTEEATTVTFSPPRSPQVPAGQMPFGVRVQSKEDPAGSVVEEGMVEVAPFSDVSAELAPRTSRGSTGASHDLAIDNRGNAPLNATISAADADKLLNFDIRPPSVVADPGIASFAKIGVKPRKRFWRGTPKTRQFQVQVEAPGAPPTVLDGSLLQEALLPSWTLRALLGALAVAVLAVLVWLFLLRPAIESTARTQAEQALNDRNVPTLAPGVTPMPTQNPNQPTPPLPSGGPTQAPPTSAPSGSAGPTASGGQFGGVGTPVTNRLLVGDTIPIEAGKLLYLTDLFFSNPGDTNAGEVRLVRGSATLILLSLENFRDLDYHFVTPIVVDETQPVSLACDGTCVDVSLTYSGYTP
jgi:hypothetical protein